MVWYRLLWNLLLLFQWKPPTLRWIKDYYRQSIGNVGCAMNIQSDNDRRSELSDKTNKASLIGQQAIQNKF